MSNWAAICSNCASRRFRLARQTPTAEALPPIASSLGQKLATAKPDFFHVQSAQEKNHASFHWNSQFSTKSSRLRPSLGCLHSISPHDHLRARNPSRHQLFDLML